MVMVKQADCDVEKITRVVQSHVPEARVESDVSAELSYILPHESKNNFEALFSSLDLHADELNIASYGASVTTMEEVFIRHV